MFNKNLKPIHRSYKSSFFSNELIDIYSNKIILDDNMAHEFNELLKINTIYIKFE